MALFTVSFSGHVVIDLPEDVDQFDAAFDVLIDLIPTATFEVEEVEEV